MSESDTKPSSEDPDADAVVREFIDYVEYLPSDITRSLWRIRDLQQRRETTRIQMDGYMKEFGHILATRRRSAMQPAAGGQLSNGVNGLRAVESVSASPREMELRFLFSQSASDLLRLSREATVEANRLLGHVELHQTRIGAINSKLDAVIIPSRDPTPEEKKPPKQRPEYPYPRINLRVNQKAGSSQRTSQSTLRGRGRPRTGTTTQGRTPLSRRPPRTSMASAAEADGDDTDIDDGRWDDAPETPAHHTVAGSNKKKKGPVIKRTKHISDAFLSGGAPARYPDGSTIPNDQLPWNQLTNEELARLRKRMKKNAGWTPSVTMIVRELESLERGPNNKDNFRDQWEGKPEVFIGPEDGGIGDPQKILPDDGDGARENKGMRLNRAKKRKREEEKRERAREAERSGLDPVEVEKKLQEEEQERQRKEQQTKRRKKKEEEEAAKLVRERREREAEEEAARESEEREKAAAEAEARAKAEAEAEAETKAKDKAKAAAAAAAHAAKEKAEQERQVKLENERVANEKAAKEQAEAEAEAKAAAELAKVTKQHKSLESDDELSDVPDEQADAITATPANNSSSSTNGEALSKPIRTSKRHSTRPPSRPPGGIPVAPSQRPKRSSAAPTTSPPPPIISGVRKRSNSGTPASSGKATVEKKPAEKRPGAGVRRKKRGGGEAKAGTGEETANADEDDKGEDLNPYCLCDEVSDGTMIACDNDDCPKEWFHLACVGVSPETDLSKIKWFCPLCEEQMNGRRASKKRRRN